MCSGNHFGSNPRISLEKRSSPVRRWKHRTVYLSRLSIQSRGSDADQFPYPRVEPIGHGFGLCGNPVYGTSLCRGNSGEVPIFFLWRCNADSVGILVHSFKIEAYLAQTL